MADQAHHNQFTFRLGEMSMEFSRLETTTLAGLIYLENPTDIAGGVIKFYKKPFGEKLKQLKRSFALNATAIEAQHFDQWALGATCLVKERNAYVHSFYWPGDSANQHVSRFDIRQKGRTPANVARTEVTAEMVQAITDQLRISRNMLAQFLQKVRPTSKVNGFPPYNAFTVNFLAFVNGF